MVLYFFWVGFRRVSGVSTFPPEKKRPNAPGRRHLRRALEIKPQVGRKVGRLGVGY